MIEHCCVCLEVIRSVEELGASAGSLAMGTLDHTRLVCRSAVCQREFLRRQNAALIEAGISREMLEDGSK